MLGALALTGRFVAAETPADLLDDPATQLSRPADRERVVKRMAEIEGARLQDARTRATLLGLPLRTVMSNGRIQEITAFDGTRPRYFTTHNANAAISTGANLLRAAPYSLTGSGVVIGLWDAGSALSTHQEFGGRVTVMDGAPSYDHSTHVGGTLIAAGVTASAHGMAALATINSYDWTSDITEMTSRGATIAGEVGKIYLSNHSYGYVCGWNYVNGGTPYRLWEWNGTGTTATSIETDFGLYSTYARGDDALAFSAPYYLIFRAAGNDRGDNPATGSSVALAAAGTTVVLYDPALHPAGDDLYRGGFDTISFDAIAKNVMTVGSASDAVTSGVRDVTKATVSYFSCWGPTDDGRIKPDIVANGDGLYSSLNTSDTAYGTMSGTSMATPNSVGSASLLIQQYGNLFPSQAMRASTLKGLLIHTADDLGNPGPDYKYGWGLVNVKAAADLIQDHYVFPEKLRITESQLTTTTVTRTHSFVWDGLTPLSATLCWTDPAAAALTASDSRLARLVNNLDLKVIAPNGSVFYPYVMPFVGTWTQASMDLPATTGVNITDNVEQVRIAAPPVLGTYQAVITFTGTLTNSSQNYSLLVSGSSAAPAPLPPSNLVATPGNNTVGLTWSASSNAIVYHVKRSATSGGPYVAAGSSSTTSYSDSPVTNGATYYYVVSAANGTGESADSTEVSVIPAALPSSTSLASSPVAAGTYGTSVTLSATVTGATGTVTFLEGITVLGSGSLNGSGVATCVTSALALGDHSITAAYAGDATFAASDSSALAYTVNPKPVTITGVTAAGKVYDGTTTAILSGGAVAGVVGGEAVTVVAGGGSFASANAGNQAVLAAGYALGGSDKENYVLAGQPTVPAATITPRPVLLTGTRVYNGTTAAGVLAASNNLDGANLTVTGAVNLVSKDVGAQSLVAAVPTPAVRVQSATGNTGVNATATISVTLPNTPVAGNTLVAVISTRGTSANRVSGITQTGAAWTRAAQATNTNGTTTEIWYAPNVSGAAKAITINQALLRSAAVVVEYSGVLTASSLDHTASATGSSIAPVTGTTAATLQANELWLGGIGFISSTPTLGTLLNSFTSVASAQSTRTTASSNAKVYALERLANPVGTASSGGTLSVSAQWAGALVTFKTVTVSTLALAGSAAGNYTLTGSSGAVTVTAKALKLTGLVANNRAYDGTAIATLTGSAALQPAEAAGAGSSSDGMPYLGDTVTVGGTAVAVFADKHAATGKPVTVTGYALLGAQAGNYSPTQPAGLSASIAPRSVTVTAVSATKAYDGTTTSAGIPTLNPPLSSGDTTSVLAQEFQDAGAATDKTIVPWVTINDGNGGANYVVTQVNDNTGVITPATAAIGMAGLTQTYNGNPRSVTATTTPSGLTVGLTYNGSATAPANAGSYAVVATVNDANYQGSASGTLVIGKAAASVVLSSLSQTYDGAGKAAGASTTPSGLTVGLTYNGSSTAPASADSYSVVATVNDSNYQGSSSGTLVIQKATAAIVLTSLSQNYDGSAKPASATTTPGGLTVGLTYDGSSTAPTHAGSFSVVATVNDPNYQGSSSGTLVIQKATAAVDLDVLTQTYDGSAKPASATTTPSGLAVGLTYDGTATVPVNAGRYEVVATVNDTNYQGSSSGSLVIEKATATVVLSALDQTYDGALKPAGTLTTPVGLAVGLTYNGSVTVPVHAGSYTVAAMINDPNYQGESVGTLAIRKAVAGMVLRALDQAYDGTAKSAAVTTTPPGLPVDLTYDGSATAPVGAGNYAVAGAVDDADYQGSAAGTLVIHKATATVALNALAQTYDGSPKPVGTTTDPSDLAVDLIYDGSPSVPGDAGSHEVVATIRNANYQGTVTGTLVIGKAEAGVALSALAQIYDGSPKSVGATTTPSDLSVDIDYNDSEATPSAAGSYAVVATVNDPNYQGAASATLVIGKAEAGIALGSLAQTYDGTPKSAAATTTPAGLAVVLTYDGSETAPTATGSYAVVATVSAPNYQGSATATLVVSPPPAELAAWHNEYFSEAEQSAGLAADDADPDGDGLSNLAEYALGTDPRHFSPPLAPVRDADGLSITFTRPADLLDVSYGAESSEDLTHWSPVPLEVLETGPVETVRARDPLTTGDPFRRMLRLRFERP
ncbi:MAG: MBG domain-containing protein [Verrucomicrobiota bacterium]